MAEDPRLKRIVELLHATLAQSHPEEMRREPHGPRFRRRERSYRHHREAEEWEREHVGALIRAARSKGVAEPERQLGLFGS